MGADHFVAVAERLRGILSEHVPPLLVTADGPAGYTLKVDRDDMPEPQRYFGGLRVGKTYVSFYLMPVYAFPDLLKDMSPDLRKRMQGKSCFNFNRVDERLMDELADLTRRGVPRYLKQKLIQPKVGKSRSRSVE